MEKGFTSAGGWASGCPGCTAAAASAADGRWRGVAACARANVARLAGALLRAARGWKRAAKPSQGGRGRTGSAAKSRAFSRRIAAYASGARTRSTAHVRSNAAASGVGGPGGAAAGRGDTVEATLPADARILLKHLFPCPLRRAAELAGVWVRNGSFE